MSKIRSKNTKAELIAFKYLRKQGIYFQKHYKRALGSPDIALPRKKKAVFIDGDFWRGREYEKTLARLPEGFWTEKIIRNVKRDTEYRKLLLEQGWKILQIWESDLIRKKSKKEELEKIENFLKN